MGMVRFDVSGDPRLLAIDCGQLRQGVDVPTKAQAEFIESGVIGAQLRLDVGIERAVVSVELRGVHDRLLQADGMNPE